MARPRQFDPEIANTILERMRDGESLRQICKWDESMPSTSTVWQWGQEKLGAPPHWRGDYARARLAQADAFAGDILEIADSLDENIRSAQEIAIDGMTDPREINRAKFFAKRRTVEAARLQIDARKWTAARMNPGNWGDRVAVDLGNQDDKPARIDFSNLSTEQLEKLAKLEAELAELKSEAAG